MGYGGTDCNIAWATVGLIATLTYVKSIYVTGTLRETGNSCCNVQLKSRFVKSILDALFLSTYALNILFVLIKSYS